MKKLICVAALVAAATFSSKAETLEFSYGASADVVSTYIWRGQYNGGLSFQPDLSIGWESEHTSFSFGTWLSFGASDWGFRKGIPAEEEYNPNTYLVKELDIYGSLNLWGVTLGFTHYYYLDGTNFFNFGDINEIEGTAQTEVSLGYDFSTLFPNVNLSLSWNTMVSGYDVTVGDEEDKRAFSTYIEAAYTQNFERGMALTGVVGVSPWRSTYTDIYSETPKNFAVNNLTLRFDKTWSFDVCELTLYAQGTMNPCNINRENAIIRASGDDKLYLQKLMGAIGVNISF